jgi:hypothetical protein
VTDGPFTPDDFAALSALVVDTWRSGADRDWTVPAGTLDWSCWKTAEHTVDCVFSYAFFLASRRTHAYPGFTELRALPGDTTTELVDGLRAVTTMLWAVVVTAPPSTRAIIRRRPAPETGSPADFAARGAHEMILHADDVCTGLGVGFDPPRDLCARLVAHTASWQPLGPPPPLADPWHQLLVRSGRPAPS